VFNNLGWGELAALVVIALFVFGPERLPKVAADAGRMLRKLRQLANDASADIKAELGPEVGDLDLASLHPRRFVQRHLLADDDDDAVLEPVGERLAPGEVPPYDVDAT
jgi:sec-independent protein translocase protein TatB